MSHESLQDIMSPPDTSIPFLDGQVCISVHHLTPKHERHILPALQICKKAGHPIMSPLLQIGLGKKDVICCKTSSRLAITTLQTLTEAWKDRMADPWTQKSLKECPRPENGTDGKVPPQQIAAAYVGSSQPAEVSSVTAATLTALREFTCHKSGREKVQPTPISVYIVLISPARKCRSLTECRQCSDNLRSLRQS